MVQPAPSAYSDDEKKRQAAVKSILVGAELAKYQACLARHKDNENKEFEFGIRCNRMGLASMSETELAMYAESHQAFLAERKLHQERLGPVDAVIAADKKVHAMEMRARVRARNLEDRIVHDRHYEHLVAAYSIQLSNVFLGEPSPLYEPCLQELETYEKQHQKGRSPTADGTAAYQGGTATESPAKGRIEEFVDAMHGAQNDYNMKAMGDAKAGLAEAGRQLAAATPTANGTVVQTDGDRPENQGWRSHQVARVGRELSRQEAAANSERQGCLDIQTSIMNSEEKQAWEKLAAGNAPETEFGPLMTQIRMRLLGIENITGEDKQKYDALVAATPTAHHGDQFTLWASGDAPSRERAKVEAGLRAKALGIDTALAGAASAATHTSLIIDYTRALMDCLNRYDIGLTHYLSAVDREQADYDHHSNALGRFKRAQQALQTFEAGYKKTADAPSTAGTVIVAGNGRPEKLEAPYEKNRIA